MKNRMIQFVLMLCVLSALIVALPITANAETEGIYTYTVSNGRAIIKRCSTSVSGDIEIPSTLGGYPVTQISNEAFYECFSLTGVIIPDSVTSIGYKAFDRCWDLTNVILSNNVSSIGEDAFQGCPLTSISIPPSVKYIGQHAFSSTGIKNVYITDIGAWVNISFGFHANPLEYAENLYLDGILIEHLVIPEGVTTISSRAFQGYKLKSVTIPDSVISIGSEAFNACALTSLTMPDSVKSIGEGAFRGCSLMTNLTLSNTLTSIGEGVFGGCSGLTNLTLPATLETIGNSAFNGCSSLTSITIPTGVTSIGEGAFGGCSGLTNLTLPATLETIGNSAFNGCSSLTSITIPTGVTSIGEAAFGGCSGLTDITIPDSVISIGDKAFQNCSKLTSIIIPDGIESIDSYCFYKCTALKNVKIGNNVTIIGGYSFYDCDSLTSITIPDSVTSIGADAFSNCDNLTNITLPSNLTFIGDYSFYSCDSLTHITIPDGVTEIGWKAFYGSGLKSITFAGSVTTIDNYAFQHCSNLESVNISDVKSWCEISFSDCYSNPLWYAENLYINGILVNNLIIPNEVTRINRYAFYNCGSLTSLTIPDSVTTIGSSAFLGCNNLTNIALFNSTIAERMFYGCKSLVSVVIPNGVTNLGYESFAYCDALRSVTIPKSVISIGRAFYMSRGLTDVYYSGKMSDWEKINIDYYDSGLARATIHCDYLSNIEKFSDTVNKNGMSDSVSKFKIDATYPANKAADAPETFDLRLYFNQSLRSANGNKSITIVNSNGDVCKNLSSDSGIISGNLITFENVSLPHGDTYSVVIDNGAFVSGFGNVFYGLKKGTFSFTIPPLSDSYKINLDYPGKYVFGIFGNDTSVPPIPRGSDKNYAEELQDWASAYGINSIMAHENPEEILDIPVKMPVTDTKGQTFLLDDGGTTVKQVMNDLIFIENLKPYIEDLNIELHNIESTPVTENLAGYNDEKELYNKYIVPYASQISKYLDKRNEKSSFFMSIATPLAYDQLLKVASNSLSETESVFVKTIADATIGSVVMEKELSSITSAKDYETFKNNISDVKNLVSVGKELYKIKTSGFSAGTSMLAIDLYDKYYIGQGAGAQNETLSMISDTWSTLDDVISCTKMSVFLGTSLGFMPMVVELNEKLQKSLADKTKAWFFIGDYYIKDKYPNIYNNYFTHGGYGIREYDGLKFEVGQNSSEIVTAAVSEYQNCKNNNDNIALSWCDYADGTGIGSIKIDVSANELLGLKRDLVNLGNIMKFAETVDTEQVKKNLLQYISATLNKSKTSEFYGKCPIVVDVYDKEDNLLATLSSENEEVAESEYGSFYILGDNNQTKYFITSSDEYRVEISAYDEGEMSIATVERDEIGNILNTSYFKDLPLTSDSKFSLSSSPDLKTILTNLETNTNENESIAMPENIRLSCAIDEVPVGTALEIKANIWPDFSQYDTLSWQVFDENYNEVTFALVENGIFTAQSEGKYIIRASISEDVYDDIIINAYRPITHISCEYETLIMITSEEKQIDLVINADASSDRIVKKFSDDENVVVITEEGTLTATGPGEATIKFFADGVELLLPVIVYNSPVETSLYQSDANDTGFKVDVINTSCQNSFVGTLTVNVFKDNILLETDTIDLNLKYWEVFSDFVDFDYLTDADSQYDIETLVSDADGQIVYTAYDVIDGFDYIVKLNMDDGTIIEMSYAEFNEYVPGTKEGYVFMGWYLDSSFEPSMKIEKLATDYGESTTLHGWWLKESELIDANITSSCESDTLNVNLDFELAATEGIAYIEIFDYDEQGELKINQAITKNISKDLEELNFDIPFAGDNQTHLLRVSFYDNIDTKKTIGSTLETEFYAERKVYETEGFCYYLTDDGEAELIGYQYSDYELWLPISLDGYPVTKIADEAFMNSSFESVIIPDTISRIGANVFGGYSYLESVKYIGTEGQWNAISIDENNETLNSAEKIFEYSEGIVYGGFNNIEFTGSSVDGTIAFDYVYRDCVAIIEIRNYDNEIKTSIQIEVPKTTEEVDFSIPFEADDEEYEIYVSFVNNSSDKVEVGDGDYDCFCAERERYTDGDFTYVLIGEHAEVIGYSGDNTEVIIPDTLGEYAVAGIGKYALSDSSIEAIEFPETLTYIEEGAFAGTLISSISIPASVISIGDFAFDYCYNLASITVDENNKNYCSDDGNLYSKDKTELVRYSIGKTETTWTIPNTVTMIKSGAISDSEYLTDVIIPNGVTHIGRYAFGWGAWETLTIPASVVNISSGAFVSCENLKEINVDSNNLNYCSDNGVLFDKNKTVLIQYPIAKTENSYKVPKGVTVISSESFAGSILQSILFPQSLETVEKQAFENCQDLNLILYDGTREEFWNIDFARGNDVIESVEIIYEYSSNLVSGRFYNVEFTGSSVNILLNFNYVYENCIAIIEIIDRYGETEETLEIAIPVGTEEKEFSIPFAADDNWHEICVSFVNNTTDKLEVGESDWDDFYAERECFTEGDYTYAISNGKAIIVSYNGTDTELEIPGTLGEYSVVGIDDYAFEECEWNGVYITSLTLPSSIESISDFALDYLYALKTINLSEENEHFCVVDNVLFDKDKTSLIKYPAGKTGSQYSIPTSVKVISTVAFADNEYLREITIPDSVTSINRYAFAGSAIQTITIPANVSDIKGGALNYCYNLTEINVDADNTNYTSEDGVLYNKEKTRLIQYPMGKQSSAFVVPNGVDTICEGAFLRSSISTIVFPVSLSYIEYDAFYRCENLQKVLYYGSEEDWQNVEYDQWDNIFDEVEFIYDYSATGIFPYLTSQSYINELLTLNLSFVCNDTDSIAIINIYDDEGDVQKTLNQSIPAGTNKMSINVLFEIDNMWHGVEILFVDNITDNTELCDSIQIEFYAERERLVDGEWEYIIVDGKADIVNYLGDSTEVEIPSMVGGYRVVGLADGLFAESWHENNARITTLTLPNSIENISDFALDCLYTLTSISVSEENEHFSAIDGILFSKDKTKLIKYPSAKTGTSYTIPNTVKVISTVALADNENLTEVILPDSVTDIKEYAFAGSAIKTITIPSSVTNIEEGAFSYCADLTEINVDANNANFASSDGALFNNDKTTLLQYPCGRTSTAYRIPEGVKIIAIESMNSEYLEEITFPKSLETIQRWAFANCNNLNEVIYPGTDDEYLKIDIHSDNWALKNANITFGYNGMPANIKSVHCWYDNNKVIAKIKFNHLEQAGTLYLAIYDEGRLVTLQEKPVTIDEIENTIEIIDVDETYKNYDVKVLYWDGNSSLRPLAKFIETEIVETILVDDVLESEHPYADDMDETKTYVYDGECVSIDLTFSDDTETESGFDYIYIYDVNDNKIGEYCGTELAGQTITVPGNTAKIRLTSDGSVTRNGYRTESIVVNK